MNSVVQLEGARLLFDGARGLREVSARLGPGRVAAVVGPSGAGKSTLLRLVAGIDAPQRGTVRTHGSVIAGLRGADYRAARDRVGLMEQDGGLTLGLSVLHNVLAGRLGRWSGLTSLRHRVYPGATVRDEVRDLLARVGLGDRLHAEPAELSGGERRRVALARLAFQAPDLWLADEPTAGLDVQLRADVVRLLLELIRDRDGAGMVVLHDLDLLSCGFDEVWGLRGGELKFRCPADALGESRLSALYEATA